MFSVQKSAAAAALVVMLAACGGGGSAGPADASMAAATAGGSSSAPTPAAVASPSASPTAAPSSATGSGFPVASASPSGAAVAAPAPSSTPAVIATSNADAMGIAVWENDVRVAAWSDGTGVYSRRFDSKGNPVGDQLQVGALGTFSGVAALASGAYAVEYQRPDAVLVQVVTPGGALAGPPIIVKTQAQVTAELPTDPNFPSEVASLAGGHGVTAFPDGSFVAQYAIYQPSHIPGSYPYGLFAQKYDSLGHAVGVPVGFGNGLTASWASTAPIAAGGLLVADILACPCSGSGAPGAAVYDQNLQSEHVRFGGAPGNNASAGAAALSNGSYVAVWTAGLPAGVNAGQVQGQVFAADASSASGSRNVTPTLTFENAAADARVFALAGGGFLLSWHGAAQAFDANGRSVSPVMQTIDGTVAATPDGGFVVLAQIGSQVVAQQYSVTH